jgi:hypothetical protein
MTALLPGAAVDSRLLIRHLRGPCDAPMCARYAGKYRAESEAP